LLFSLKEKIIIYTNIATKWRMKRAEETMLMMS
jgi:hypothetical protein